jgi:HSP20 family molecular chaperone IbpA
MKNLTIRPGGRSKSLSRTRDLFAGLRESLAGKRKGGLAPAGDLLPRDWPSLEVSENDEEVAVKLEVPGLTEKDIELGYVEGTLLIKGEKKEEKEDRKHDVYYRESVLPGEPLRRVFPEHSHRHGGGFPESQSAVP